MITRWSAGVRAGSAPWGGHLAPAAGTDAAAALGGRTVSAPAPSCDQGRGPRLRSERFRGLWARQDVRRTSSGVTRLRHPQVGDLDLRYEKLAFPQAPGQTLIVYHAEVGTPSHDGLQLLAHLTPPTGPGGLAPRAAPSGRPAQE